MKSVTIATYMKRFAMVKIIHSPTRLPERVTIGAGMSDNTSATTSFIVFVPRKHMNVCAPLWQVTANINHKYSIIIAVLYTDSIQIYSKLFQSMLACLFQRFHSHLCVFHPISYNHQHTNMSATAFHPVRSWSLDLCYGRIIGKCKATSWPVKCHHSVRRHWLTPKL
jgi:hypothetical protein